MFRLLPRGLPKDPEYPTDLQSLGYFINDEDEIRSIENPKYYFKYFINRNERFNERQRESMNTAIRSIVSSRLAAEGMQTLLLPLGVPKSSPHIPILASSHIYAAPRVVLLLGDSTQDLGIFALRIVGGHGGINAGSAVDFVKYVHAHGPTDTEFGARPDVILANCGQLRWNRRQGRAMTRVSWDSQTRESAVHDAVVYDPTTNTVEGQRDQKEHIKYLLSTVVPALCMKRVKLDVIAIADSARYVCEVLDEQWADLGGRMESLALVFPFHEKKVYRDEGFVQWLGERARGYVMAEPGLEGKGMFGPGGGKEAWQRGYGMNVYGLPVEVAEESVFPRHFREIVDWMGEVARDPEYVNEEIVAMDVEGEAPEEGEGEQWGEQLVGPEVWETDAGKAQLRGDTVGEVTVEDTAGVEKGDVDETKNLLEGVVDKTKKLLDGVVAQLGKVELDKESVLPQQDTTKEGTAQTETEAAHKIKPFSYDGAADEPSASTSTSIPPERMERLPSYVETDEGEPQVKLSKEEKAAILQITVLSSPVRGKGKGEVEGVEETMKGGGGEGN